MAAADYQVSELGDGVHLLSNGLYQSVLIDTGEGAVVVDAPPSLAGVLVGAVRAVVGKPVTHVVYSHAHGDHIGAAGVFAGGGATTVAHHATAELLSRHNDANRPIPTTTFDDVLDLHLGRHEVRLAFHGPSHSPDTVVVHLPAQRVVVAIDIVLAQAAPFRALTVAADVPGLLRLHRELLAYDADTYVGGHFSGVVTRADIELAMAYLQDLVDLTAVALRSVTPQSGATAVAPTHPYEVAAAVDDRIADIVAGPLLGRWRGSLPGLAVFVRSHVTAMADSLRYDYNVPGGGAPPTI